MPDPLRIDGLSQLLRPVDTSGVASIGPSGAAAPAEGKDFKSMLIDSLEKVDRLQKEADAGVERLATGQTDNVAEVFTAVRKAEVAFDLLMEIRNKLTDAYKDVQQMRV